MPDFILSPLLESPLFQQLCDQLLEQPGAAAYEIGEGARAALAAAIALKTGARGLRSILEQIMLDVMYKIPGDKTIEKVIITGDTVEKGVPAEIVRRNIA